MCTRVRSFLAFGFGVWIGNMFFCCSVLYFFPFSFSLSGQLMSILTVLMKNGVKYIFCPPFALSQELDSLEADLPYLHNQPVTVTNVAHSKSYSTCLEIHRNDKLNSGPPIEERRACLQQKTEEGRKLFPRPKVPLSFRMTIYKWWSLEGSAST